MSSNKRTAAKRDANEPAIIDAEKDCPDLLVGWVDIRGRRHNTLQAEFFITWGGEPPVKVDSILHAMQRID